MIPSPVDNPSHEVVLLVTQQEAMFLQAASLYFVSDLISRDLKAKDRAVSFFYLFCPHGAPTGQSLAPLIDHVREHTDFQRYGLDTSQGYVLGAANDAAF